MRVHVSKKQKIKKVTIIRGENAAQAPQYTFEAFQTTQNQEESETPSAEQQSSEQLQSTSQVVITEEEFQAELKSAYDQGFLDGREVASKSFQRELELAMQYVKSFDSIILQLQNQLHRLQSELEAAVLQLGILIAEAILKQHIHQDALGVLQKQIKKVFDEFPQFTELTIRLHPDDIAALQKAESQLAFPGTVRDITLVPDSRVERGGCIVDTPLGIIDAQPSTQLEKLRSQLEASLHQMNP